MYSTNIPPEKAELHAWLYALVSGEITNPDSGLSEEHRQDLHLRFLTAKEQIKRNCSLTRNEDTGLWHYAGTSAFTRWLMKEQNSPGYFQVLWPAGRYLSQILAEPDQASLIDDKCILSVGTGSALAEIKLVKTHKPRLVACLDNDIYARAAIELNAEANDVEPGDVLITLSDRKTLKPIVDGAISRRLYDTVLASDCLYSKLGRRFGVVKHLALALKYLNDMGADILISDRDEAELERRIGSKVIANFTQQIQNQLGLTDDCLMASAEIEYEKGALFKSPETHEPVTIHHWPASKAERPLPRLDIPWWHPPM